MKNIQLLMMPFDMQIVTFEKYFFFELVRSFRN